MLRAEKQKTVQKCCKLAKYVFVPYLAKFQSSSLTNSKIVLHWDASTFVRAKFMSPGVRAQNVPTKNYNYASFLTDMTLKIGYYNGVVLQRGG